MRRHSETLTEFMRGTRALLGEVVRISSESGGLLAPAVWTLRGFKFGDGKKLTSFSEKCSLFRDAGIEYLFTDNYESVRNLSPYEFISNHVIGKMNCFHSVCGYNFSFGSGASGSSDTMRNLMLASGRDSTVVPPYAVGGSVVSSTAIRELLACGRVAEAAAMLDRPYSPFRNRDSRKGFGQDARFSDCKYFAGEGIRGS